MNIRKMVGMVWLAGAMACCGAGVGRAETVTYKVDPVHSMVGFKINHLGVSNLLGRFNAPGGTVIVDEQDPTKSALAVEIEVKNIDTNNEKRDEDLRSANFFDAKQFPTITFKTTAVKKLDDATYELSGDLTLHGVTKPLTVKLTHVGSNKDPWGGFRSGYEATFTIKRSDFGMTYLMGGVGDAVTLMVSLEGVKQ